MIRRLVAVSVVALCAMSAVPSHAAKAPVKLYLNQMNDSCANGADFAITASPADAGHGCVYVDRIMVDGQGSAFNESFAGRRLKTVKLDTSKPLTGSFTVHGYGVVADDGPALIAVDFIIKVAKKKVGVVRLEGQASPTSPVTKKFSIKLPASLNKVPTSSVSVTTEWSDCVGMCGIGVSGESFLALPVR